jgi:PAS domain S-box-containing protein
MNLPLRVLHLEDNRNFSALVSAKLAAEGFTPEVDCVETREDFGAALEKGGYDLIIADYHLPGFDGLTALQQAREKLPHTPVLLVSGTIGEAAAVASLKAGASDYVLKQWPERLVPAVKRALKEAEEHKSRLRMETALVRREKLFRILSTLGLKLSSVVTAEEAAKVIVETADDLFGWDACTLNLYSPDEDKIYPILSIDTIRGEKLEIPRQEIDKIPTTRTRRILKQGAELVLREEPLSITPDGVGIGDKKRPSASLMFVPIRNRTRVIGILSIQSYQLKAYDHEDLAALQTLADHCGGALERIRAEQALKGSEMRFHSVWENSVDGMRLTDETGTIVAVNQAFCDLVGMKRQDLEGMPFTVTYAEGENRAGKLASYQQRFKQRKIEKRIERRLTFRSGKTVDLEGVNSFFESRGQKPLLLCLLRDITEQKRLGEQLRHSQKMDAIGQLAGGVAHDFNNILTVIQGHASLLRLSERPDLESIAVSAEQICQAAERAAGLTRQLLTFSRRQMIQLRQLDLNTVVSHMTKMLGRILGEDITLQCNYSNNPPLVHADVGMMEQILLNLAVNSRDAMPSGGQLTVKISVLDISSGTLREHSEGREGKFVCLSIKDTGCGIEPKTLPHIFEPFFTTKPIGKGTGLGLATVYGIIKQHQGWVEVESQIGAGTAFNVFLPHDAGTIGTDEEAVLEPAHGGTETILVVEDEAPVRELVCKILRECGYEVLVAANGAEALKVWEAQRDNVDLLLTDIVMPDGMTGRDLAAKVQAEKPGLMAIFTSGYSAEIVGKDFIVREDLNFLQKPYAPQKLISMIRRCLDRKPAH